MRRNAWIDFVRILFSVGIFLTHLNSLAQPTENVDLIYCFGFLGVEFFFIISGYFMAASANNIHKANRNMWERPQCIFFGKNINGFFHAILLRGALALQRIML